MHSRIRSAWPSWHAYKHHGLAGQFDQPGHDARHHVVMVRVAAGGQLRPPPHRHQPDPPVQRPRADLRPAQVAADPRQGPRARAPEQRGDPARQPAPAQPGPPGPGPVGQPRHPLIVEPADPAAHGGRVAVQQRRDLAAADPCSDNSTITSRVACRHRPCRSPRSCSIWRHPTAGTVFPRAALDTRDQVGLRTELLDRRLVSTVFWLFQNNRPIRIIGHVLPAMGEASMNRVV
jgi:hypothetical protein